MPQLTKLGRPHCTCPQGQVEIRPWSAWFKLGHPLRTEIVRNDHRFILQLRPVKQQPQWSLRGSVLNLRRQMARVTLRSMWQQERGTPQ